MQWYQEIWGPKRENFLISENQEHPKSITLIVLHSLNESSSNTRFLQNKAVNSIRFSWHTQEIWRKDKNKSLFPLPIMRLNGATMCSGLPTKELVISSLFTKSFAQSQLKSCFQVLSVTTQKIKAISWFLRNILTLRTWLWWFKRKNPRKMMELVPIESGVDRLSKG